MVALLSQTLESELICQLPREFTISLSIEELHYAYAAEPGGAVGPINSKELSIAPTIGWQQISVEWQAFK